MPGDEYGEARDIRGTSDSNNVNNRTAVFLKQRIGLLLSCG